MRRWIVFNMYSAKMLGEQRGYDDRETAELAAKHFAAYQENWYVDIGVFQHVSSAKHSPSGELTRLDEGARP